MTPTTVTDAAGRGAAFLTGGSLLFATKEEKALAAALDQGLDEIEQGESRRYGRAERRFRERNSSTQIYLSKSVVDDGERRHWQRMTERIEDGKIDL